MTEPLLYQEALDAIKELAVLGGQPLDPRIVEMVGDGSGLIDLNVEKTEAGERVEVYTPSQRLLDVLVKARALT